jgi:hypothetical protein
MNTKTHYILLANMKSLKGLSPQQLRAIEKSMIEYSIIELEEFKSNEIQKAIRFSFLGIPKLCFKNIIYFVRTLSLNLSKKLATQLAYLENREVYVIRDSLFGFTILTSLDIKYKKKKGIIRRNLDFIKRKELIAYTAKPPKK